jgi:predicted alpha/beta superfamily hydrolase
MISKNPYSMKVFELEAPSIGDKFVIRVSVPASYEMAPDRNYPVLYVLDGDAAMGVATTTMDYINLGSNFGMGKNVPDMIVVGIGYERGAIPWLFTRVRDFSPTVDASFNYNNPNFQIPASGGADKFYQFLIESVMPAVAENFRVDPSLAVLAGHSMGGLFALYAMLQPNPVFHKYLLASPFVGWDNRVIFKMEEAYAAKHKRLAADVFLSYCAGEPTPFYRDEVVDTYTVMTARKYESFRCVLKEYPEENHFSVISKAFCEGLYALFAE